MIVDLVQFQAADGLRLDGALQVPPASGSKDARPPIDAWLMLHGTGSNFYLSSLLWALSPRLLAGGAAVLIMNTRGHDLAYQAWVGGKRRLLGAAFEVVQESAFDIAACVNWLKGRGFPRVGILGHSLGAVKAICSLAGAQADSSKVEVAALVAVSPPRLSYAHFQSVPRSAEFLQTFSAAEAHVAAGRGETVMDVTFPLPYLVSAASYVDRYGKEERCNVLKCLEKLPCPTLVTYGTRELQADAAFTGMPEAIEAICQERPVQVAVIAGADHLYTGVHDALADRLERWINKLTAPA